MDFIQVLLLLCAVIGVGLMVFTLIGFNNDDKSGGAPAFFEMENNIKVINSAVEEAEKAADELNKFAESVLTDIGDKQQELMFLYNLIEEKKNEVARLYSNYEVAEKPSVKPPKTARTSLDTAAKPKQSLNPKHDEIIAMHEKGMSVQEISKTLDMGQGEVKLIIQFSGVAGKV